MSFRPPKPSLYAVPGGVYSLSGPALQEFLRAVLARGKPFRFRARGFSMHPFIQDGDVVTVSPLELRPTRVGEVVACCHPPFRQLVVHRVLARGTGEYLLGGDNAPHADGLIPAGDLLGWVTGVERRGQRLRLGLGPERRLVALLGRHGLLRPMIYLVRRLLDPLLRRWPA